MEIDAPIVFEPLFMERVWGGRSLEKLFNRRLPPGVRIGESWEIVDREEAQSVVHHGKLRGKTLHDLWTGYRELIFGNLASDSSRFPLLFKLLDAQERLSVQVHPPAKVATRLSGEPKTEAWFVMDTQPGSDIFAGLKQGVTPAGFQEALHAGSIAGQIHRIETQPGDVMFIPSGRVHAIGAGNVICEVQQNSDTTYRVFDWNRTGLDGKARALHIDESMQSIDFKDIEPSLAAPRGELIVECEYFRMEKWNLHAEREAGTPGEFSIFTCLAGKLECGDRTLGAGDFFLVAAAQTPRVLRPLEPDTSVLRTTIPR
jgi:mannose-6-phosphate isomerase